uniref:Uncharacterized protein n=1 Tax=Ciona savignyi TaxID=51511 RepID=H2Z1I4_CIOSA
MTGMQRSSTSLSNLWMPVGIFVVVGLTFGLLYGMDLISGKGSRKFTYTQYLEASLTCSDQFFVSLLAENNFFDDQNTNTATRKFCSAWGKYVNCRRKAASYTELTSYIWKNGTLVMAMCPGGHNTTDEMSVV